MRGKQCFLLYQITPADLLSSSPQTKKTKKFSNFVLRKMTKKGRETLVIRLPFTGRVGQAFPPFYLWWSMDDDGVDGAGIIKAS